MRFRFLYLGASGNQTEVASLDDLRVLVEKGTVGELTPLFDALTQQWAPARGHAVYRLLCEESQVGVAAPGLPPAAPAELPDLGLTVTATVPSSSNTDQAVRDLLRERERDGDDRQRRADPWTNPASWGARPTPPAPAATHSRTAPEIPRAVRPSAAPVVTPATTPPSAERRQVPRAPAPPVAAPAPPARASVLAMTVPVERLHEWAVSALEAIVRLAEHRAAPATLVATGLTGLLIVLVSAVRGGGPTEASVVTATIVGPEVRGLVGRFAIAEDSGFRHMVAGMDSLRRAYQVAEVPPVWLEGNYLADATRYPEVKDYWLRYRSFLDAVQASDTALFRTGFVAQLRNEGMQGPVLSLRLSQAMTEFEQSQPTRSSMYLHMQELASASLALHELLVEREPDISFEPAFDARLSRDPVIEALPLDTLLRDRMWVLLDRIFASLERLGGDLGANRDNLTQALLQGVEASQR